jgi:enamine deaminase RidA (YjgF/YER057c/UK114 family)
MEFINPEGWPRPKGYSNGVLAPAGGRLLSVAGCVAWDENEQVVSDVFSEQFGKALSNVVEVCKAAGGSAESLTSLTIFVTNKQEYLDQVKEVGAQYREIMGKHFPAMALIEIAGLIEEGCKIEIQGTAVIV